MLRVFKVIFNIFSVFINSTHSLNMRFNCESFLLEFLLFLFCSFRTNYNCHFNTVHIINSIFQAFSFQFVSCLRYSFIQFFNLIMPVALNFIIHLYCCELINRNNHTFSTKSSVREVLYNVFSNSIKSVVSFNDF